MRKTPKRIARRRIGLHGQPEHRAEIRIDLQGPVPEQSLDVPAEGDPDPELGLLHSGSEPLAQQVTERPVGEGLAV